MKAWVVFYKERGTWTHVEIQEHSDDSDEPFCCLAALLSESEAKRFAAEHGVNVLIVEIDIPIEKGYTP